MNQKIAERWADALRSGQYEQGSGYLHKVDGSYCCLGVLCELYGDPGWEQSSETPLALETATGDFAYPSTEVLAWADMDQTEADSYAIKNDELKWSFEEIADYIVGDEVRPYAHEEHTI